MGKIKITEKQARLLGINSSKNEKKKLFKITKEQYNRIFASGLINETIDKNFKQGFTGKDIKDLAEDSSFNISKPNTDLSASVNGKFNKPITEDNDNLRGETLELIKFLYRKTPEFPQFWVDNNLTFEDICEVLTSQNLIIQKNGKYELSKTLGNPESAINAVETELRKLIGSNVEDEKPELETENFPLGAEDDLNAPYNQTDDYVEPKTPTESPFNPIYFNNEITILKYKDNSLYVFFYEGMDKSQLKDYASIGRKYIGRDEEGEPDYEYDNDFEIDADIVANYINDNISKISIGQGSMAYERGVDLVKIDDELKQELISLYSNDKKIMQVLGGIQEVEKSLSDIKTDFNSQLTSKPIEKPNTSQIVSKLQALKQKEKDRRASEETNELGETTTAASSGAFTGPLNVAPIKKDLPLIDVPVVKEMTSGSSSVGAYDANAFPNIKRNGTFKENHIKNESRIFETIAKKTGKTINEIKLIISQKNKPL